MPAPVRIVPSPCGASLGALGRVTPLRFSMKLSPQECAYVRQDYQDHQGHDGDQDAILRSPLHVI
jgi:hypothetical protein